MIQSLIFIKRVGMEIKKYFYGYRQINRSIVDWNEGFHYACYGGHKEICDILIEKGANDWNNGLAFASRGGHKELCLLLIEKGATEFNLALLGASRGGHIEICLLMIEKGGTCFADCFFHACRDSHKRICLLMVQNFVVGQVKKDDETHKNVLTLPDDVFLHNEDILLWFLHNGLQTKDRNKLEEISPKIKTLFEKIDLKIKKFKDTIMSCLLFSTIRNSTHSSHSTIAAN